MPNRIPCQQLFAFCSIFRLCAAIYKTLAIENAFPHNQSMFTKIIHDLKQRVGYTDTQLADAIGCNQSHITRIKNGQVQDPCYSVGVALVNLHTKMVKGKRK